VTLPFSLTLEEEEHCSPPSFLHVLETTQTSPYGWFGQQWGIGWSTGEAVAWAQEGGLQPGGGRRRAGPHARGGTLRRHYHRSTSSVLQNNCHRRRCSSAPMADADIPSRPTPWRAGCLDLPLVPSRWRRDRRGCNGEAGRRPLTSPPKRVLSFWRYEHSDCPIRV
jgi:hypothetical protein